MLTVGGKPIIERLFEQLVAAGFQRFVIVTGFLGATIEQYMERLARDSFVGTEVVFLRENEPLGNAGALGRLNAESDTTLFLFSDLVTDINFSEFLTAHWARRCAITLASHDEEHQLSLGELIASGDRVERYLEKPRKRFLICSGIAAMEPPALDVARGLRPPFGISDLVNAVLQRRCEVTHWVHGARWLDVNTPEILQRARAMFAES